jgi:hypothetical protein
MPADLPVDYAYVRPFDRQRLRAGFPDTMRGAPKYNPASVDAMIALLGLMELDIEVRDVRWMAYMLATAYWETAEAVPRQRPTAAAGGAGTTASTRPRREWRTMVPNDEVGQGRGRRYHLEVKVQRLATGGAVVMEQDGDSFTVSATGAIVVGQPNRRGTDPLQLTTPEYLAFEGSALRFHGRGFVHLTWWDNYAVTGAWLGVGLDLLLNPERATETPMAYRIMSYGMRTGRGFANRHRLEQFFVGQRSDYAGARAMVNGVDHKDEIADIARRFERLLLSARPIIA